ncbi:MobB protein [Scytonema sp. UIC 10036]|uniref:plasmid mobilization protein n=1 Tax=Scytonema sp. UIC 10036 TaxID=2304196 RepID=UPI0012DA94DB|nr:MobB protein [Scytonema sp. UIC 10036]MUG91711.1 MobB protein [Scytonema sp. UIC 10036]
MKRSHRVEIVLSDEEKTTIESKAFSCGVKVAQYIRDCALRRSLYCQPSPDLIAVRGHAGMVKSELMMLSHLASEASNEQMLDTVRQAIAQIDLCINAAFRMSTGEDKPSELPESSMGK